MTSARQRLLELLAEKSFRLGEFKLSSGATSDYYIDCRTTTLDAEGARTTASVVLDEIHARNWRPQAIGGLTLGADPIVASVAALSAETDSPIHGFIVRKAEKSHGTTRRIEGFVQADARVVIVDDVCTTGSSTVQAIEATRQAGMVVVGVMCLVEREEAGGRAEVERVAAPAPFIAIFQAAEIRQQFQRSSTGRIEAHRT
ncbi:MAG TPA: orotate phosphoribosyltransferase [Terriglobales bacterium]|nr:orotate phosphoribosyltransferase [Terriglobales bacterium]